MNTLSCHVDEYLAMRRAVGFKLERAGALLTHFVDFADRLGVHTVTVEVAVRWATLPANASPVWVASRLSVVRGFARYLQTVDVEAESVPADLLAARVERSTPYLYSDTDIAALMAAARALPNPLKAATFETLIGLLAATGMRGGEAMRLDVDDVDWAQGLITVHDSKFGKSRQVYLHETTLKALQQYCVHRDQLCPSPATASLLVSTTGARLCHAVIQPTFRQLLRQAGVGGQEALPRPRIHALRHSFAVRTLLSWYRRGRRRVG
jgi:integrase/recombinase XerD